MDARQKGKEPSTTGSYASPLSHRSRGSMTTTISSEADTWTDWSTPSDSTTPRPQKAFPTFRPSRELRLFAFDHEAGHVHLELATFDLNRCPEYTALSYVPGSIHDDPQTFFVNNGVLEVTKNLADFLLAIHADKGTECTIIGLADGLHTIYHLHDPKQVLKISGSIDLQNPEERYQQFSHEYHIFSNAKHSLAWLGNAPDDFEHDTLIWEAPQIAAPNPTSQQLLTLLYPFASQYWYQPKMVQEILLGNDISFCCGRSRISALSFVGARYMLRHLARELSCAALKHLLTWNGFERYLETLDNIVDQATGRLGLTLADVHSKLNWLGQNQPNVLIAARSQLFDDAIARWTSKEMVATMDRIFGDHETRMKELEWLLPGSTSRCWKQNDAPLDLSKVCAAIKLILKTGPKSVAIRVDAYENITLCPATKIESWRACRDMWVDSIVERTKQAPDRVSMIARAMFWARFTTYPFHLRARGFYDDFIAAWDALIELAVTARQQVVALELRSLTFQFKNHIMLINPRGDARSYSLDWKTDDLFRNMVRNVTRRHGFEEFEGSYLAHPDEWPFSRM